MIETVLLKKPIDYPNELRHRVQVFNKALFDKYWAPLIPLDDLQATVGRFTVISPTPEEELSYAALVAERDQHHDWLLSETAIPT